MVLSDLVLEQNYSKTTAWAGPGWKFETALHTSDGHLIKIKAVLTSLALNMMPEDFVD